MNARRVYVAVGAAAAVVYLGVLWNGFALDDLTIIVANPLVHSLSGVWRAFALPYFPANLDASVYRPLTIATYALDWSVRSTAWFHAVNLMWHVAASVLVAVLARRWAGDAAGLVAGVAFAVHPVHVEAVANVVGRNELMAAVFTLLAVYAALERGSPVWSAAALAGGLLSKENAAVVPGLVAAGWILGVRPVPPRRTLAAFVASWAVLAAAYTGVRWAVLGGFGGSGNPAPVFLGQDGLGIRLTATAALGDVARLLVLPLSLSADYSPAERTAVQSLWDARLVVGVLVGSLWALLLGLAWRRQRKVEALGLAWICDRLRARGEPALPHPDLDRRADALSPVRGAGDRPGGRVAGTHGAVARRRGSTAVGAGRPAQCLSRRRLARRPRRHARAAARRPALLFLLAESRLAIPARGTVCEGDRRLPDLEPHLPAGRARVHRRGACRVRIAAGSRGRVAPRPG